ncbi:MAG: hypothetical protein QME61_04135 [Patescibacteria group bacterium]|nr:hypothetical protein [Patescibacteria group bacterium]
MEIEFDFREEESNLFGPIFRPVARLILINNKTKLPQIFYVDSGADITLIPKSVGEILGFKVKKDEQIAEIKGVGERGIPIVIKKAILQINEIKIKTKIAWSLIEEVPLLLGREDFFKFFEITFVKNRKTIFRIH